MQTIAMNSYLDQIFRTETTPGENVKPLTVLLIDELEEILPHIYSSDTSWQDIMEERFINGGVVIDPMHTTLAHFANKRAFRRRQDTFLKPQAEQLNRIIAEQYAPLRT
jgi:hypothetical protein